MATYRSSTGDAVRLGSVLGKGGEGVVHDLEGRTDVVAKIYLPGLADERREKVVAMVDAGWHANSPFVAYPIEALFEGGSGAFAGFTMRKVGGHKPVHELYSPTSRKTSFPAATYPFLIRTVANVARAFASVHATGCVVGDINHSGVLIAPDATVTLIDSDSFQVRHAGRSYPCKVGVPEFTPPELQGKPLDRVDRTGNHDAFGLAVLVFYTLMMGRHPFAGRFHGSGDMPMERAIAEFRFAYSGRRSATLMDPPPHVPTLADLPMQVADAFERAFGPAGATVAGRPTAADWVGLVEGAEASLVQCGQNKAHHHFRTASGCPWCRMETAYPGFLAFAPAMPSPLQPGGGAIDLGRLIAAVRGVPDPGDAPELASLMPTLAEPGPSPAALRARRARMGRWVGAAASAVVAALVLTLGKGVAILGLLGLGGSAFLAFGVPAGFAAVRAAGQAARDAWRKAETDYEAIAGNRRFRQFRQDAEDLLRQLQDLPAQQARRISDLDGKRRDAQMRRHLERHPIDAVRIKGVGNARKLTLRSYGIETAADVDARRIDAIHGFGPSTAGALMAWRRSIEARFAFDPRQGVAPQDVAAVISDISQRRAGLESRLRPTIPLLQQAERDARAARTAPPASSLTAWAALRQASVDERALQATPRDFLRFVAFGAAGLAGLAILHQARVERPSAPELPPPAARTEPTPTPALVVPEPSSSATSRSQIVAPTPSDRQTAASPPTTASFPSERPAQTGPSRTDGRMATVLPSPPTVGTNATRTLPNVSPQDEIGERAQTQPPPAVIPPQGPSLNLLSREDANRVQQRLLELGYFGGIVDGVWGPRSRAALRDFRRASRLGSNDQWDGTTQAALLSSTAVPAGAPPSPVSMGAADDAALPPPPGAVRNPLNRTDGLWLQARLRELGFYSLEPEGVWGPASREALRDFKAMSGLPANDTWDAVTERRLADVAATRAQDTFVGGFAPTAAECDQALAAAPPVTITYRRAEANGGVCEFDEVVRDGETRTWRVRARCSVGDRRWVANVRLTLEGRTLLWANDRGVTRYSRCR